MKGCAPGQGRSDLSLITFMEAQVDSAWEKSEPHSLVYSQAACSPATPHHFFDRLFTGR
jgi:hypothetical protein